MQYNPVTPYDTHVRTPRIHAHQRAYMDPLAYNQTTYAYFLVVAPSNTLITYHRYFPLLLTASCISCICVLTLPIAQPTVAGRYPLRACRRTNGTTLVHLTALSPAITIIIKLLYNRHLRQMKNPHTWVVDHAQMHFDYHTTTHIPRYIPPSKR